MPISASRMQLFLVGGVNYSKKMKRTNVCSKNFSLFVLHPKIKDRELRGAFYSGYKQRLPIIFGGESVFNKPTGDKISGTKKRASF